MPDAPQNTIVLSPNFYLNLANGRFDSTDRADLDALFQNLQADAAHRDRIVVYFHGGLVDERAGMGIAQELYPIFYSAGGYPIFFVWEAGPVDVVTRNLREIFDERIFQRLLERVTQFALGKLRQKEGQRGTRLPLLDISKVGDELRQPSAGKEPYATVKPSALPENEELQKIEKEQFEEELESDFIIQAEAAAIANGLQSAQKTDKQKKQTRGARAQASRHTLMSPEVLDDIRSGKVAGSRGALTTARIIKGGVAVLARVIKRFAERRDHGLYPTIVEEILREFYLANVGQLIWSQMKKDTADAFGKDAQVYGGTAFLEALKTYWATGPKDAQGQPPRLILVGHSTGAVYICNLLKQAAAQSLPADMKFELVFLAPACTFELFAQVLAAHKNRIAKIRIFTMHDSLEAADQLVPLVYPRSLLYFVSGVVEDNPDQPILGMERYYSRQAPYDSATIQSVCDYLLADPNTIIWSEADAGGGLSTNASSHGAFDDNKATRSSLQHILAQGF